jgi:hypothetical protein
MNDRSPSPATPAPRSGLVDLLDRPDDLPEAIEERIVGPDLWELVSDLERFHGPVQAPVAIAADMLTRILNNGLVGLSDDEFHALMRQPRTLLQVQKVVLSHGSEYWDEVARRMVGPAFVPAVQELGEARAAAYRPWYRSPAAWAANVLTGLAASVAFLVLLDRQSTRLDDVERQLRDETARNDTIGRELFALKQAHPRTDPTDLPEVEVSISLQNDPADLPEGDPDDLPVGQQQRRPEI